MFDASYFDNSKVLKFNTKISIKIEPNNYGTLFWAVIKFDKGYCFLGSIELIHI